MNKYLSLLIVLMIASLAFGGVFTIASETTGADTALFGRFQGENWSKVIYTQAEINTSGLRNASSIASIGFYMSYIPANYTVVDQRVYMRHTSASLYDTEESDRPDLADFQLVFQGDLVLNEEGWLDLTFEHPFLWNGIDNLEFYLENDADGRMNDYPGFASTDTYPSYAVGYNAIDGYADQMEGAIRSPELRSVRLITSREEPPSPTTAVSPVPGAAYVNTTLTLQWNSVSGANGYKLYFGSNPSPALVGDLGNVLTYVPGILEENHRYYWQVIPYNGSGEAAACPVWSFMTMPHGLITIGDGTASSDFPFYSSYGAARTQTLFTVDELLAAGAETIGIISAIGYDIISE